MDDIGIGSSAAGYRLVRRLGSGRRADVFLGHVVGGPSAPGGGAPDRAAAIKLFRPGTDLTGIDSEIGALARARSPHLLRLDDLATAQDGLPILVLGLLRAQSLAQMLAVRSEVGSGEAVTILAPIAAAVAELHRVGVAHGAVTAGSVLFDELGTPVLASFGRAQLIGEEPADGGVPSLSPAELAVSAPALRDLASLATLARTVLECAPESAGRSRVLSFVRSTDPARAPERFASDLANVLFDSAPAAPVSLAAAARGALAPPVPLSPASGAGMRPRAPSRRPGTVRGVEPPAPGIRGTSVPASPAAPPPPARGRRRSRPAWLDAVHLPEWLEQVLGASIPSRTSRSGLAGMLASVRRSVWVAAAVAAVLLTAALLLVPGEDASSGAPDAGVDPPTSTGGVAPSEPGAPPGVDPSASGPEPSAVAGDDPVAASLALLERREGCLASLSVLCLDDVDQAGSAAWESDSHLIRKAQESEDSATRSPPPAASWEGRSASLVERIGNSALVAVAPPEQGTAGTGEVPVSVLLIRGVEGWRIRDVFIG